MKNLLRKLPITLLIVLFTEKTLACINCNKEIKQAIFNSAFYPNVFLILSPFLAVTLVVTAISIISVKRYNTKINANPHLTTLSPVPLTAAATVTGIGLGAFFDGILFHQILQWHEMISNKIPPVNYIAKSVNMFWDGVFHTFAFIITVVGIILLWRLLKRNNIDRSGNLLAGGILIGFSLFNILEGIADHQILKLHNVREVTPDKELWNMGFLVISVILLIIGFLIARQKKHEAEFQLS